MCTYRSERLLDIEIWSSGNWSELQINWQLREHTGHLELGKKEGKGNKRSSRGGRRNVRRGCDKRQIGHLENKGSGMSEPAEG